MLIKFLLQFGFRVKFSGPIAAFGINIIAQAPKMAPHIDAMCATIAADLQADVGQINVKATTSERLGFTGRKEGIAVEAVVLVVKA